MVLDPRRAFNPAGNIHAVRPYRVNGFHDRLRPEPTCKDCPHPGVPRQHITSGVPVERDAQAARSTIQLRIQEHSWVGRDVLESSKGQLNLAGGTVTPIDGPVHGLNQDDFRTEQLGKTGTSGGVEATMQLHAGQPCVQSGRRDLLCRQAPEDADALNPGREPGGNLADLRRRNLALARREDEPDGIGPGLSRRERIR